jgi:hypothetical protein
MAATPAGRATTSQSENGYTLGVAVDGSVLAFESVRSYGTGSSDGLAGASPQPRPGA